MERILPLEKGEIVLGEEKITIRDKAKKEKFRRIASSSMWTIYGILSILRYMKTGDEFLLWTGSVIGLAHLAVLIYSLFRTTKGEIGLHEIGEAVFKERNGNKFLDLKLKGGAKRRISKVDPVSDELREFFKEKKIEVQ
ncbi:hypothetical protein [Pontibacter oryzae]|uniref:Uncharacterized protein n=1 Tax=Pontibacter oryzae TaxID=2304593 RepID=A0A399S5G3_9BACT|nr:hypothetical protein [Pontibacter oryzae]RIJ37067.1 hypothetical protein D1627_14765 [Pontibacter oryzae]